MVMSKKVQLGGELFKVKTKTRKIVNYKGLGNL